MSGLRAFSTVVTWSFYTGEQLKIDGAGNSAPSRRRVSGLVRAGAWTTTARGGGVSGHWGTQQTSHTPHALHPSSRHPFVGDSWPVFLSVVLVLASCVLYIWFYIWLIDLSRLEDIKKLEMCCNDGQKDRLGRVSGCFSTIHLDWCLFIDMDSDGFTDSGQMDVRSYMLANSYSPIQPVFASRGTLGNWNEVWKFSYCQNELIYFIWTIFSLSHLDFSSPNV